MTKCFLITGAMKFLMDGGRATLATALDMARAKIKLRTKCITTQFNTNFNVLNMYVVRVHIGYGLLTIRPRGRFKSLMKLKLPLEILILEKMQRSFRPCQFFSSPCQKIKT